MQLPRIHTVGEEDPQHLMIIFLRPGIVVHAATEECPGACTIEMPNGKKYEIGESHETLLVKINLADPK